MTDLPTFIQPTTPILDHASAAFLFQSLEKLQPFSISAKLAFRMFQGGIEPFKDILRENKIPFEYNEKTDAYEIDIFLPLTNETDEHGFFIGRGAAKEPRGLITSFK
jgi:hypothetical protein